MVLLPRQLSASREDRSHQPRGLEAGRNEARRCAGFCHAALVDGGRKLQGKVLHQNRGDNPERRKACVQVIRRGWGHGRREAVRVLGDGDDRGADADAAGVGLRGAASLRAQADRTGNPTERSDGGKSLR